MKLEVTPRLKKESASADGDWLRAGCLVAVATGLACTWVPWISLKTEDFGEIRRTDGWGQGPHGCDQIFTHTCNPDPVPATAHAAVAGAIVAGCAIVLWMVARSVFVAGLVGLASGAAARSSSP